MHANIHIMYTCLENPMDGGAWQVQSMVSRRIGHLLSDFTFTFHFHALEREIATHSSVLAWRIPGTGSLVSCHLWARTESGTTEVTQQFHLIHFQIFSQVLSLFFWGHYYVNFCVFDVVQKSLKLSSFLYMLLSLFCSAAVISTTLSSNSLIHPSASFIVESIPSSVFFISVIVFVNSGCSLLKNFL